MDFSRRKLPPGAASELRSSAIEKVEPYTLMVAPAYVFMRRNEKFVAVKSPLDFFTPAELSNLRAFEKVYFPRVLDEAEAFQSAARRVRAMLSLTAARDGLTPPPYEVSEAILAVVAELWGASRRNEGRPAEAVLEPFFAAIFVEELCGPRAPELLVAARDRNVAGFERAILLSGWAVFMALHLGYCELDFLSWLRGTAFERAQAGPLAPAPGERRSEIDELLAFAEESIGGDPLRAVHAECFGQRASRAARKLAGRFARVMAELMPAEAPGGMKIASIYGERGFVDV